MFIESYFFFCMPAYCLCLTQNNTTPHVQWTWNNQRRFPVCEKKTEAPYRLTLSFCPDWSCFLLFSSVFSAGFDSERNLRCGFARRHLTISWNWHRSSVTTWCTIQVGNTSLNKVMRRNGNLLLVLFADVNIGGEVSNWANSSLCTTTPSVWLVPSSSTRL